MHTHAELERRSDHPTEDHVVRLSGVTWGDYERLLEVRGERPAPRMTYLEGELELMSPSREHEQLKTWISHLVAAYCFERGVRCSPYGSWTLRDPAVGTGAEPDECYVLGDDDHAAAERPHLAIEVVWTSGRMDKLDAYRLLRVQEVWVWRKGRIQVHALRGDRYEPVAASELLPGLDLAQLLSFLDRPSLSDAVLEYRRALAAGPR